MTDRRAKLTKAVVEATPAPPSGQVVVWDTALAGFGLRVGAGGARTFILMRRIGGRQVKRTIGRFGVITAEQARKDAVAMAAAMAGGVDPAAERKRLEARWVTLRQATAAYLADRDLKPRTVRDVQTSMKRDFADWQALPITEIRPAMVEDRFSTLVAGKASGAAGKLSMRYLRAVLNYASAKFSDDSGDPILPRNPVKRLSVTRKGWTGGARRRSFIKPAELKAWVEAVQGLEGLHLAAESRDALMLGLLTGVRPSEALSLRWADIDAANRTLTFRDTKNRTDHELPLTRWLADMLEARRAGAGPVLVFSDAAGTPLKDVRAAIARVTEKAGVGFMPSDLRRTFVTTAERLDIGPYSLKRMLNHALGGDVTAGYIIPTTDRIREPMQRVEDWMLATAGLRPTAEIVGMRGSR